MNGSHCLKVCDTGRANPHCGRYFHFPLICVSLYGHDWLSNSQSIMEATYFAKMLFAIILRIVPRENLCTYQKGNG